VNVIAYTYEADHHCVPCALARFGQDENGWVPENAEDGESNPVGAVFEWDEWYANDAYEGNDNATLGCGTCGDVITEVDLT
jgi:hypothetical protein